MPYQLEKEVHRNIPLSQTMGFQIKQLSQWQIHVTAPIEPNINIHGTGFAGSIYSLGSLTAWALVRHCFVESSLDILPVLSKASIQYKKPITKQISCRCSLNNSEVETFLTKLKSKKKAKLILNVNCGENAEAILTAHMIAHM